MKSRGAIVRDYDDGARMVEVSAAVPELAGVWLRVRPGWRSLGMLQDLVVGDEVFDDRYLITADHEDLARWLLDGDVRAALTETWDPQAARPCEMVVDEATVWCRAGAGAHRDAVVARMTAVVEAVAARPAAVAARWRQLAVELRGSITGDVWPLAAPIPVRVVRPQGEVTISLRHAASVESGREPWIRTAVQVAAAPGTPLFALARLSRWRHRPARPPGADVGLRHLAGDVILRGVADDGERTIEVLRSVDRWIAELAPACLHSADGVLSIVLDGEATAPTLELALATAFALSAGARTAAGPYR